MSKKVKIKWAVIGASGMAGKKVIPDAIGVANNCELVAVQGLHENKIRPLAEKWRVPWYISAKDMLDKVECDAVYIASPQNVHSEHTKLCANKKLHVFCEKPLARNFKEAKEMVKVCQYFGVKMGTGFNFRFNSLYIKAREIVASGIIGKVVSARCQFGQNYSPDPNAFRQNIKLAGGGSMIDIGIHAIDLIEFVSGKRFSTVMAITQNLIHNYNVEDACGALLEFSDGGFAFVDAYYCIPINILRNDLEVNGSRGILYTVESLRGMGGGGKLIVITEDFKKEYEWDGTDMYKNEFEAFSNAIIKDEKPPCNGFDGLHSQMLSDAIYNSARTGKKIQIKN